MARADRNTLHHSRVEEERQQRQEQPKVSGATGASEDTSPEKATTNARKRRGKTGKNTSEDTPEPVRRTIRREPNTTQLIERGEGPTAEELVDPEMDVPNDNDAEGGLRNEEAFGTLEGGVYPDQAPPEDSPNYGDWLRHSSG
jgi:hypothetical protein